MSNEKSKHSETIEPTIYHCAENINCTCTFELRIRIMSRAQVVRFKETSLFRTQRRWRGDTPDKVKSLGNRREKAGPSSGLAGTAEVAEVNRTRASTSPQRRRAQAKTPEASCAWTVTLAFARLAARSRQLHNGIVGLCSFVLLLPPFLSGGAGPKTLDGRPSHEYYESLLVRTRARSLSHTHNFSDFLV